MLFFGDIINDIGANEFRSEIWTKVPYATMLTPQIVEALKGQLPCDDIETVILTHRGGISAHFEDSAQEYQYLHGVTPEAAWKLYRAGATLLLADFSTPVIENAYASLCGMLGCHPRRKFSALFLAPPGAKTRWHFDQLENFNIQLHGAREWKIAANTSAQYPVHNFSIASRDPLHSEIYFYAKAPIRPTSSAESRLLKPGSLLYLPRGYWHEVGDLHSKEDSIALILSITAQPWIEFLLPLVRALLLSDSTWRETVPLPQVAAERLMLQPQLEQLKADLIKKVSELDFDFLLPRSDYEKKEFALNSQTSLCINPFAVLFSRADNDPTLRQVTCQALQGDYTRVHTATMPRNMEILLLGLPRNRAFTIEDILSIGHIDLVRAHELVRAAIDLDYIVMRGLR